MESNHYIIKEDDLVVFKKNIDALNLRFIRDSDIAFIIDFNIDTAICFVKSPFSEWGRHDVWSFYCVNRNFLNFRKMLKFSKKLDSLIISSGGKYYDYSS